MLLAAFSEEMGRTGDSRCLQSLHSPSLSWASSVTWGTSLFPGNTDLKPGDEGKKENTGDSQEKSPPTPRALPTLRAAPSRLLLQRATTQTWGRGDAAP